MSEMEPTFYVVTESHSYSYPVAEGFDWLPDICLPGNSSTPAETVSKRPFTEKELETVIRDVNREIEWKGDISLAPTPDEAEAKVRRSARTTYVLSTLMVSGSIEAAGIYELFGDKWDKTTGVMLMLGGLALNRLFKKMSKQTIERESEPARVNAQFEINKYNTWLKIKEAAAKQLESQKATSDLE